MKSISFFVIGLLSGLCSCNVAQQNLDRHYQSDISNIVLPIKVPVDVPYFNQNQILLPDYVCSDTLIVVDASGLNKAMAYYEQGFNDFGDAQLDSMFHRYCKIK